MRMTRVRTGLPITFAGTLLLSLVVPAASVSLGLPATGTLLAAPQVVATAPPPATAEVSTKVLTIDDYARWRSIGQASLSPDGRWVTYAYSQREVDDSLFIKALEGGDPHIVVRGGNATFSPDSRWVAYYVNPQDSVRGRRGRGAGAAPGGGRGGRGGGSSVARALELLDLETEARRRWENVQAFEFAEAGEALIVKKRAADSDAEHDGTDLIVRYLTEGVEELLAYVNEFALDEPGGRLAYTVDGPAGEANGVHLLDLVSRMRSVLDAEREAEYRRLTWGGRGR